LWAAGPRGVWGGGGPGGGAGGGGVGRLERAVPSDADAVTGAAAVAAGPHRLWVEAAGHSVVPGSVGRPWGWCVGRGGCACHQSPSVDLQRVFCVANKENSAASDTICMSRPPAVRVAAKTCGALLPTGDRSQSTSMDKGSGLDGPVAAATGRARQSDRSRATRPADGGGAWPPFKRPQAQTPSVMPLSSTQLVRRPGGWCRSECRRWPGPTVVRRRPVTAACGGRSGGQATTRRCTTGPPVPHGRVGGVRVGWQRRAPRPHSAVVAAWTALPRKRRP